MQHKIIMMMIDWSDPISDWELTRQEQARKYLASLIQAGDQEKAKDLHCRFCARWWPLPDFEKFADHVKTQALLDARRATANELKNQHEAIKADVLRMLSNGELELADSTYEEKCKEWWDSSEYELDKFRFSESRSICESYSRVRLRTLGMRLGDTRLGLQEMEIARLKRPKVDIRLARYGISLDQEQRSACARPDRRLLIRARAGSGKTRTLAAIAALAIDDEQLDPDQVLTLAFNTKAAREIGERIQTLTGAIDYKNSRTFHSLAYRLTGATGRELIFDDGRGDPSRRRQAKFVERTVRNILNPAFKDKLHEFFRRELEQIERIGVDLPPKEYFTFRRAMSQVGLSGESVKSTGEKFIADFLFEHGIEYKYERPWSWNRSDRLNGSPYHPDFSIHADGRDLILEHWAIDPTDPSARVPDWWENTDTDTYRTQIDEKREFWAKRGIPLLETHTGMLRNGREAFEAKLGQLFEAAGVPCIKLGHEELVKRVVEAPHTISRIAELFLQFISRAKKRGWTVSDVDSRLRNSPDPEPRHRVFHQLALRAYAEYERLLEAESAMDFDDLLALAKTQVDAHQDAAMIALDRGMSIAIKDLRWLLLDEFQDFSELYCGLVDSILRANPEIRLVAVGDDWQAINGFAGAQLKFFECFGTPFPGSGTVDISTNYRSAAGIVDGGNRIMAGRGIPAKASKSALAAIQAVPIDKQFVEFRAGPAFEDARRRDAIYFVATPFADAKFCDRVPKLSERKAAQALKACARFIVEITQSSDGCVLLGEVLILARTGYAYGLELAEFRKRLNWVLTRQPELKTLREAISLDVMTAHKSKGKEADTVVVLDVTSGSFPKIHPDNLLFAPFGVTIEDTLAEERRLFYVAVTRAESRLLLLTETGRESSFLKELTGEALADAPHRSTPTHGVMTARPDKFSEIEEAIKSRIEAIDLWDMIIGNASPQAVPALQRLRREGHRPPNIAHTIKDGAGNPLHAEFAWLNLSPPVATLTGQYAARANEWRKAGWIVM